MPNSTKTQNVYNKAVMYNVTAHPLATLDRNIYVIPLYKIYIHFQHIALNITYVMLQALGCMTICSGYGVLVFHLNCLADTVLISNVYKEKSNLGGMRMRLAY